MAGEQVAKSLDEMIEQMFKVARRALQSSNATPLQRTSARTLIQRRDDLAEKRQAYAEAKQARQDARLARRRAVADANVSPESTDFRSKALRALGMPTAHDRAAQAAQKRKRQAKVQEEQGRKLRDATKEAKNKAFVAFELAQAEFLVQFPHLRAALAPRTREMAPTPHTFGQNLRSPEPVSPPRRPSPRP